MIRQAMRPPINVLSRLDPETYAVSSPAVVTPAIRSSEHLKRFPELRDMRKASGPAAMFPEHCQTIKRVDLVMTPLRMALWECGRQGHPAEPDQIRAHSDAGSQYTSVA